MSIQSEHYIVVSKCLIRANNFEARMVRGIDQNIVDFMEKQGYPCVTADPRDFLFGERFFLGLEFYNDYLHTGVSLWSRFKLAVRIKNKSEINAEKLRKFLRTVREEYPLKVTFTIEASERGGKFVGYAMKIESEPAIIMKKAILGRERWVNPSTYQDIIGFNERFQRTIISSIAGQLLEGPSPISPRGNAPTPIIEWSFVDAMLRDVGICVREANLCFQHECYVACSIMLRKAMEVAVNKKFYQSGNGNKLFDKEGNELSLSKKLVKLGEFIPEVRKDVEEMKVVKLFGDKGAHDPTINVTPDELQTIVVPRLKSFLSKLSLRA